MQQLNLTLPTTAQNLALDEWLLQQSEQSDHPREVVRLWENPVHALILGRSSKVAEEVNQTFCDANGIDFFRRASGGAAVAIGPGCLMYSLVLDYRLRPELKMLDRTHDFVMQKMQDAIRACGAACEFLGTCDLALEGRKFSGNSLRCQRHAFLYHGTLLYDFDLDLLHHCLGTPPRQPEYRDGRSHRDFVANLPCNRDELETVIIETWSSSQELVVPDLPAVRKMATEKYMNREWTHKR